MRLSNGGTASLQLSLNCKAGAGDTIVIGDQGTLLVNGEGVHLDGERIPVEATGPEGIEAQLQEFFAAICEGREPEASGQQVCATTMTALEGARFSLDRHTVVDTTSL